MANPATLGGSVASPLSDPVENFLGALRSVGLEPRRSGAGWTCRCPAHDDRNPSLSINKGEGDEALIHCHSKCRPEAIVAAIGLTMADLYPQRKRPATRKGASSRRQPRWTASPPGAGGGGAVPPESGAPVQQPDQPAGCTLSQYAEAKRLPVESLRQFGLSDLSYQSSPAVRIPYTGADGSPGPVRFRTALEGPDRFRWKSGSKLMLYGLDRLDPARRAGYITLVEGESDCHTLWFHGEPAVGVPGAGNWNEHRDSPPLTEIATIFVVREPDSGGERLLDHLADSSIRDRVRIISLDGFKDTSQLHLDDPEQFRARWEAAKARALPLADEVRRERERQREEDAATAADLIHEPNILGRVAADLERAGVVGEQRLVKLIYLAVTSRLLSKPVSVAVKGPSSAGKSYSSREVLRFFPPSAYYALSAMSERALAYSDEPVQHRTIVLFEAAGMTGDFATYLLRSLLSEGCIKYETVEKTRDGLHSRLIERDGPTNLLVTTTAVKLHSENETRLISLPVTDTPEQTAAIMRMIAEGRRAEPDYSQWHAFQDWVAGGDLEVAIPFAPALADLIPPVAVRLRRDFPAVLALIQSHALLHQALRRRDANGRIVATLDDYAAVRELVALLVSDGIGATVSPQIRETVAAVSAGLNGNAGGEVSLTQVMKRLKLDKSAVSRRCRAAIDRGFLVNHEEKRGKPMRLALAEPLPDDVEILPAPEVLHRCTVTDGDARPLPPSTSGAAAASHRDERRTAADDGFSPHDQAELRERMDRDTPSTELQHGDASGKVSPPARNERGGGA